MRRAPDFSRQAFVEKQDNGAEPGCWTPGALVSPRRLGHREAIQRLCAEFDEDGPDCGYNAVIQDYASIWWKQANSDPNLTRFPDHHRQLAARLKRMTGRTHSTKA